MNEVDLPTPFGPIGSIFAGYWCIRAPRETLALAAISVVVVLTPQRSAMRSIVVRRKLADVSARLACWLRRDFVMPVCLPAKP